MELLIYETTETCATVRMSVSNKFRDFYSPVENHATSCKVVLLNNIHNYTAGTCSGVVFCQFVNLWDHNFAVKAHIYLSFSLAIFGVVRYPHNIHSIIAVLV